MATTTYGDITPRTEAYAVKTLLKNADAQMVTEQYGQITPLPANSSKTVKFRRYKPLAIVTSALTEGVSPTAKRLEKVDVSATLSQYGDVVEITDVVQDTHEDPILNVTVEEEGRQAAESLETARIAVLKSGSNVVYAGGVSSRALVNAAPSLNDFRTVARAFKRQRAQFITQVLKASKDIATEPVAPSFVAIVHPDMEADIRAISGFIPVEKYATQSGLLKYEIGKIENFRIVCSILLTPWESSGASGTSFLSDGVKKSSAANCDVYPILCLAKDAYGITPFKGKSAAKITVLNPGTPRGGDPLGQKGTVGWKAYSACLILRDEWMCRIEASATATYGPLAAADSSSSSGSGN